MTVDLATQNVKDDFCLPEKGSYLLSHSVGRPLKSAQQAFSKAFFSPWEHQSTEPWQHWLGSISSFQSALGQLFNHRPENFCPQVNLSSALCKLVMSLPRLTKPSAKLLMSELDFPSMGFALRHALPECEIVFIPKQLDISCVDVWNSYLKEDLDLVFISQVYSNSGQQAPVKSIVAKAKQQGILTLVDVAQSAGVVPLDLSKTAADFMIGSSVKWLCSGPGAAYLWVHPNQIADCEPKDVGWFSHEDPFEFDIHHFRYHHGALRFWGGTPSVAPFILAAHSINYANQLPQGLARQHNLKLLAMLHKAFGTQMVSPKEGNKCSGTAILQFADAQDAVLKALKTADIAVDVRSLGIRISPHIYNDEDDMQALIEVITKVC
ncbi:aminotransferase class V-fold PLP-dependent enzyme [uncultured Paraglaciecola sp.]|uniref:aminotransferase class V-fold PLP-dependent enzyme n=1 Tax=uncultured Paraglaciecola sp. TaxID=1765024 RepID=UPI0030D721D3|tara:strand:- start:373815 stop:374951 length:1137 start_codon:yes stop_codon:yes gene_type:complete